MIDQPFRFIVEKRRGESLRQRFHEIATSRNVKGALDGR
jgi:hypothetical protein